MGPPLAIAQQWNVSCAINSLSARQHSFSGFFRLQLSQFIGTLLLLASSVLALVHRSEPEASFREIQFTEGIRTTSHTRVNVIRNKKRTVIIATTHGAVRNEWMRRMKVTKRCEQQNKNRMNKGRDWQPIVYPLFKLINRLIVYADAAGAAAAGAAAFLLFFDPERFLPPFFPFCIIDNWATHSRLGSSFNTEDTNDDVLWMRIVSSGI